MVRKRGSLIRNYEPGVGDGVSGGRREGAEGREEAPEGGTGHSVVGKGGGDPEGDGVAIRLQVLNLEKIGKARKETVRRKRDTVGGCSVGKFLC